MAAKQQPAPPQAQTVLDHAQILTLNELAARLKVKPTWVYEHMRAARRTAPLPALKVGRYWRFYWPHVSDWLLAQATGVGR